MYRENNAVADAIADRGCIGDGLELKITCGTARQRPQGLRVFFDGTGGKSTSAEGGAGWVVYACFADDLCTWLEIARGWRPVEMKNDPLLAEWTAMYSASQSIYIIARDGIIGLAAPQPKQKRRKREGLES